VVLDQKGAPRIGNGLGPTAVERFDGVRGGNQGVMLVRDDGLARG